MSSVEPVQCLNLDATQQQNFVRFYKSMPPKPPTTIQIFNRGDYYTCHGPDARVAGMEVFKTVAGVKYMGAEKPKLEYQVLSKNNFDKLIRDLLLIKQYNVEVYVNQGRNKAVNQWILEGKGSPGNLAQFEDVLFESGDITVNAIVMAVKVGKNHLLGVSCVDAHEYTFSVCEFTDNEFFSQLEAIIIQMAPQECILQLNDVEATARLKAVLKRCNINCNTQKKMPFKRDVLAQDLNRLLYFAEGQKESCYSIAETSLETAMGSLHAVINYLELLSDQMYFSKFRMKILDTQRLVHLDAAAVKALNLLPQPGLLAHGKKNTNLLGLLDNCKTAQGHRTIAQWVKQPLRDINVLTDRLDIVETFVNDTGLRQVMYKDHLRRIPDLLMLSKRLLRKKAKLRDVYRVYEGIKKLPAMLNSLRGACNKTIQSMFVDKLNESLLDMEKFQCMVESTLDLDLVDQGEFLVKSSFQEELQELADTKLKLQEKIQQQLNAAARDLSLEAGKGIKLDYTDQLGYFLRVTLKDEYRLRNKKEYKILSTVKGSARFTTAKIDELNSDYMEAKRSYEQEQKTIATEILQIAVGYAETMTNINFLIGQLDVLVTFAMVACSAPKQYVRPVILPEGTGRMRLVQMRHPCMEAQDHMSYHPNDIEFVQDECTFHVVTGPNMGGKSTYIRSVGVVALMAHIGCFVPCDEAAVPILDSIMARVGSEDCQAKGLSTFMLEMVETAGILRTATPNSLVIIDELGRGTSTYEGCGLAWSIAETLATENKSFAMFATHFHEITELANEIPTVTNKYVTAMIEDNKLILLYEVKPGVCDQSYGIHCAKMAEFPQRVLQHAQEIQDKLEDYRSVKILQELSLETRQKYVKDGDKLIFDIVDRCKKLDYKRMNDDELNIVMKKFKSELQSANNPYLQGFILQELNLMTE